MIRHLAFFSVGLMIGGSLGALIGIYRAPDAALREIRRVHHYALGAVGALHSCRKNRDVWMARALDAEQQLREETQLRQLEASTWGQQ